MDNSFDATEENVAAFESKINAIGGIDSVNFVSKREYFELMSSNEELVNSAGDIILPDSFNVKIADLSDIKRIKKALEELPQVDSVSSLLQSSCTRNYNNPNPPKTPQENHRTVRLILRFFHNTS